MDRVKVFGYRHINKKAKSLPQEDTLRQAFYSKKITDNIVPLPVLPSLHGTVDVRY